MKKIVQKVLIILILTILLTEFSFSNVCNASQAEGFNSNTINAITNAAGGIVSVFILIIKIWIVPTLYLLGTMLTDGLANVDNTTPAAGIITPFKVFFNKYKLLDINFFDMNSEGIITPKLRHSVATWFYIVRNISASILLVILIYIGIRMAITTVASDKAKYQKMLFDWAISLILIFTLQYIAIFIIYINNAIVELIQKLATSINDVDSAVETILLDAFCGVGIYGIMAFVVYVMITIQTFFFLMAYINRLIKLAFLIIISPLIAITYSIDKIGDGKAQALNTWLKEFMYTILIQPFDCIMYVAFVSAAAGLLTQHSGGIFNENVNMLANAALAILCLKFVNDGEKMIRKLFHFEDMDTGTSMAANAAMAVMVVQRTQKAVNNGIKLAIKFTPYGKAIPKDIQFLKGTNIGQKFTEKTDKVKEAFKSSKVGQGYESVKKGISGFNKQKNAFFQSEGGRRLSRIVASRRGTAMTLGAIAAAMAYAGGDTDALEAFAMGKKISRTAEASFAQSINTVVGGIEKSNADLDEADMKKLDSEIADTTKFLQDKGLSEEEMNDIDTLETKANEAKNNAKNVMQSVARARRPAEIARLKAESAELMDKINNAEDSSSPEVAQMQKEYEKMQARIEQMEAGGPILKEELDAVIDDERVVEAQQKAAEAQGNLEMAKKRRSAIASKKKFYTEEAIKARMSSRGRSVSDSELKAQKDKIIEQICKISALRRLQESDETDINAENLVNDEDYRTAESLTEKLISTMQHNVLTGSNFDVREYIGRHIGISVDDNPESLGYKLATALEDYKYLADKDNVAKNGFEVAEAFGVKRDDFAERLTETAFIRNGEQIDSEDD